MSLDEYLRDRETSHGTFEDTATLSQTIKEVMRRGRNWQALPSSSKEALDGVAMMIARILNGDASDPKHWNGAAGYLRLRSNKIVMTRQLDVEGGISQIARRLRPAPPPRVNDEGGAA